MNIDENTETWGITEAAEKIGMTIGRLYYYYKTNRMPPHRIEKGKPVFKTTELLAWEPIRLNAKSSTKGAIK